MILAAFFVAVAISLTALTLFQLFGPGGSLAKEKQIKQRLSPTQAYTPSPQPAAKSLSLLKKNNISNIIVFKEILDKRDIAKKVLVLLQTAGLKISVSTYFLICLVTGVASFFILKIFLPVGVVIPISIGLCFAPFFCLSFVRGKYLDHFTEQLPNALSIVSGAIKVGHGLELALGTISKTAPQPIAGEFATVQAEMKLGLTLSEALSNLYERIKTPELKILVTGITINQQLGGNLSELLGTLEKTIRERFQLAREVKSLSSQGIMSATVLFVIPFLILGLLFRNDSKLMLEFFNSPTGRLMVLIAVVFQVIAFFWIRSIIRLKD